MLTFDGAAIVYRQDSPSWSFRLFAIFLGLGLATCIPLPFIVHTDWLNPSPVLLLAVACIVFPIFVGGVFVLMGTASATELRLDPVTGRAERELRGPIVNRRDSFRLSDIAPPDLIMRDSEDGSFPILRLRLPNRSRIEMACFVDRADAERWRESITRILPASTKTT
jgi:hypothetical protein